MQFKRVLLVCVVVLGLATISSRARTDFDPMQQQDVIRLENRVNQLEQRLYTIDSSLRNLEQQSRLAGTVRGANPEDIARLHQEIQALQNRLAEHECALAKLDERTLSPATRAARRTSGSDPCRLNFDTPVQLSTTRND